MLDQIQNISLALDEIISVTTKVVSISAVLATIIPESTWVGLIIHKIAFNFGKARNEND